MKKILKWLEIVLLVVIISLWGFLAINSSKQFDLNSYNKKRISLLDKGYMSLQIKVEDKNISITFPKHWEREKFLSLLKENNMSGYFSKDFSEVLFKDGKSLKRFNID